MHLNMDDKDDKIIDGKKVSAGVEKELEKRIYHLKLHYQVTPGLAVIFVGDRTDSSTYVRMKQRKAEKLGIHFLLRKYDVTVTEQELLTQIDHMNQDPQIHGIIVQLPLPAHINRKAVTSRVSVNKDVDGFHEMNMGKLALAGYTPNFIPCTPRGVWKLIKSLNIDVTGKHVVVLGKSNIVGLPMALLMMKKEATVSVCNAETAVDLEIDIVRTADILITAVGKPFLVKKDWIRKGAIIIDIGINRILDASQPRGYKLVGDVDFEQVKDKASKITPVPGGVGPMTVIMLMKATVQSCEKTAFGDK